jgi:hypothetical protein
MMGGHMGNDKNPVFNRKHTIDSIKKMSISKSKNPLGLYDINNNLISKHINQVKLAKFINLNFYIKYKN